MTTIKQWESRLEEAAHFSHEDYENDKCHFMQAEIDELRAENARLRAALHRIRQEPSNTMSDGKALKEIIRITRAALGEK